MKKTHLAHISGCVGLFLTTLLLSTLNSQLSILYAQGTAITYQGRLNDGANPANAVYDLRFSIYDSASAGALIAGPLTNSATGVSNGLFTVTLDFGASVFTGPDRWLDIGVRTNAGGGGTFTTLTPRQKLSATPYAITAANITGVVPNSSLAGAYSSAVTFNNTANSFSGDGGGLTNLNSLTLGGVALNGFWQTTGNAGTTAGPNFLGTIDNQPLEFRVNGARALRLEPKGAAAPNLIGGYSQNSAGGFQGVVIAGGGTNGSPNQAAGDYAFIGSGTGAQAGAFSAVVDGAQNSAQSQFCFIGSGSNNGIGSNSDYSTIAGGQYNSIQAASYYSMIGGGYGDVIQTTAPYSTIGGGYQNTIQSNAYLAVIGGGAYNMIQSNAYMSVIGGGIDNLIQANATEATIVGGHNNTNQSASFAFIGGGGYNVVQSNAFDSVIGGGGYNNIQNDAHSSAIAGGGSNTIQTNATYAAIAGGNFNTIQPNASFSTIGGGGNNSIQTNSSYSAIAGGNINSIQPNSPYSAVGGGYNNAIQSGSVESTIGGGHDNIIQLASYAIIGGGGINLIQSNAFDSVISGGGYNNIQNDSYGSAIGGGDHNTIQTNASFSTISGGSGNAIQPSAFDSVIGGGVQNTIQTNSILATIGGGGGNTIQTNAYYSTISGGIQNTIQANSGAATIAGGYFNIIQPSAYESAIGGGVLNLIQSNAYYSTIVGGIQNTIQTNAGFATIAGGFSNAVAGNYGFAAGQQAQALHQGSFVWADSQNVPFASTTTNQFNVRAQGGVRLVTSGAGISLDGQPLLSGSSSLNANNLLSGTVADARLSANVALLNASQTFTGGNTFSSGQLFTGQIRLDSPNGFSQSSAGSFYIDAPFNAGGRFSVLTNGNVGLGTPTPAAVLEIQAGADSSGANDPRALALAYRTGGYRHWIRSRHNSAGPSGNSIDFFLNTGNFPGSSTGPGTNNVLTLTLDGGNVGIGTNTPQQKLHVVGGAIFTSGSAGANQTVSWSPGNASWSFTSDRNTKNHVAPVDPQSVLEKLARIPINEWNYIGFDQRHIGPMAQDFHAQFPLNSDDKSLNDADLHGVALAAIQGLNEKVEMQSEKDEVRLQKLEAENTELKQQNETLEKRLYALELAIHNHKSN